MKKRITIIALLLIVVIAGICILTKPSGINEKEQENQQAETVISKPIISNEEIKEPEEKPPVSETLKETSWANKCEEYWKKKLADKGNASSVDEASFFDTMGSEIGEINNIEDLLKLDVLPFIYVMSETPEEFPVHTLINEVSNLIKDKSPKRYESLKDPNIAARFFLNMPDGEGIFTKIDDSAGYLEAFFENGDCAHIYMALESDIWYPYSIEDVYWQNDPSRKKYNLDRVEAWKNMNTYLEEATADSLRLVTESVEDGYIESKYYENVENKFFILAQDQEHDMALYGLYGCERMALRVHDMVIPLYMPCTGVQMILPAIACGDYDSDGEDEYAIKTHYKTGTGVSGDDIHFIEIHDGEYSIHSFDESKRLELLNQIEYEYDETFRIVSVHENDRNVYLSIGELLDACSLDEGTSAEFEKLAFGDIESFFLMDGRWYYAADGGIATNSRPWPQYECSMRMICPVNYTEESGFSFGQMQFEPYYYQDPTTTDQTDNFEKVLKVLKADLAHDGKTEDVVLSITCADEESKNLEAKNLLRQGEICYVRAYPSDGAYNIERWADTDGYCASYSLWESAPLAEAHAGNGMVFLIRKDCRDYLMSAAADFSQGAYSAFYKVVMLAEYGSIPYTVDEEHIYVDLFSDDINENSKALDIDKMVSFTERFNAWIEDGELLIKTSIEDGNVINISGAEKYEAWKIWKSIEDLVDDECAQIDDAPASVPLKDMHSLKEALTSLKERRLYWVEYINR